MSNTNKKKIIAIVGPTATGKSDLGVYLAKKFKGEIISADSRQVYKGMNLGTGKITKKEMRGVPHHLLDMLSPKTEGFSVNKFKQLAEKQIEKIQKNNHIAFLVGGTGFWIDAVASNQNFPDVPPNPALRKRLEKQSAEQLIEILKKLDPERAAKIDWKNKRRVIRAIEIAKGQKKNPIENIQTDPKFDTLYIGLDIPDQKLKEKIKNRLRKRIKLGMIKEVQKLHSQGVSWRRLEEFGLEYRFVAKYLQKEISKEQMFEQLEYAIWHYAKRQRTWFKRNKNIIWLDPTKKAANPKAAALVKKFLS